MVTTGPGTESDPDWTEANLMWLNVVNAGNGGGAAYLRFKVNEPNQNEGMFGVLTNNQAGMPAGNAAGTLGFLDAPSLLGTWGMTFSNDTNVTIFGPGGVSTNLIVNEAWVQNFVDPLDITYGAQPNSAAQVGEEVVLANASITNGGVALVYDNFIADNTNTAGLNPEWVIDAGEPNTVQLFPNDPAQKLVQWTLPALGYGVQTTPSLTTPWTTLSGPDATNGTPPLVFTLIPGALMSALVPGADLANTNQAFFRVNQQTFVQLQVLMPGETNAPGTPTGKTGTPDVEFLCNPQFPVTINACDANWTILTSVTDGVSMTSNDSTSSAPVGSAATSTLVAGTVQIPFNFGQTGTFTCTATDTTNTNIPAATSSPHA